jgi:hypothetical protein
MEGRALSRPRMTNGRHGGQPARRSLARRPGPSSDAIRMEGPAPSGPGLESKTDVTAVADLEGPALSRPRIVRAGGILQEGAVVPPGLRF